MHATADRLDFAPPPPPARAKAIMLALLAHLLLMLALTWGVNWNRDSENTTAEAELWSSIPLPAAAKLVEAPSTPAPAPIQAIEPPSHDVDIALEQAKKKQQQDRKKLEEQIAAAQLKAKQREEERKLAALREEQLRRMQGLANATGGLAVSSTAQRSAGPSDSYGGRIRARVRPNIVFADEIPGNPTTEVEVQLAPDGTITSRKVTKSSGVKSWDDAVLRALDKTQVLPRDVDGRVHTPLLIFFQPKD